MRCRGRRPIREVKMSKVDKKVYKGGKRAEYKKPERKSHGCVCCLTSFLIIVVVLVAVVIGGGIFAYNRYARPYTGLEFGEIFSVIQGLYKADKNKIVTNPYDPVADLENFNTVLNNAMFQASGAGIDIEELIKTVVEGIETPTQDNNEGEIQTVADGNTMGNSFLEMLKKLKFDFSRLKEYEGTRYTYQIIDKQVAAILGCTLQTIKQDANILPSGAKEIVEYISIDQVSIHKDESGKNVRADMIVSLDITSALSAAIGDSAGFDIKPLLKLLPRALYLKVNMNIVGEGTASIQINQNSDKQNELTVKLINNIYANAGLGEGENIMDTVFGTIDKYGKEVFTQLNKYIALEFVESGMEINPLQGMLTALNLSGSVTDVQFLYMLRFVLYPDEKALEDVKTSFDKILAGEFYGEFKASLGIASDVEINSENMLEKIKEIETLANPKAIDFSKTNDESQILLNYHALSEIMTKQLNLAGENEMLKYLEILKISMNDAANQMLNIDIRLNIREFVITNLGESNDYKNIIEQILPETIYVRAYKSMSDSTVSTKLILNAIDEYSFVDNTFNDKNTKMVMNVISSIYKVFGGDTAQEFSYDYITSLIDEQLDKALESIRNNEYLDLKFDAKGVIIPSVYEIVLKSLKINDITPDNLRLTLKEVYDAEKDGNEGFGKNIVNISLGDEKYEVITDLENEKVTLSLSDKAAANMIKDSIKDVDFGRGFSVSVEQAIIANLNGSSKLETLAKTNAFYADIINRAGDKKNLLIMTIKADLQQFGGDGLQAKMIPSCLYLTYVYAFDTGVNAEKGISYLITNEMDGVQMSTLETLLNHGREDKDKILFNEILSIVDEQVLNKHLVSELENMTLVDVLKGSKIDNYASAEDNGYGRITYEENVKISDYVTVTAPDGTSVDLSNSANMIPKNSTISLKNSEGSITTPVDIKVGTIMDIMKDSGGKIPTKDDILFAIIEVKNGEENIKLTSRDDMLNAGYTVGVKDSGVNPIEIPVSIKVGTILDLIEKSGGAPDADDIILAIMVVTDASGNKVENLTADSKLLKGYSVGVEGQNNTIVMPIDISVRTIMDILKSSKGSVPTEDDIFIAILQVTRDGQNVVINDRDTQLIKGDTLGVKDMSGSVNIPVNITVGMIIDLVKDSNGIPTEEDILRVVLNETTLNAGTYTINGITLTLDKATKIKDTAVKITRDTNYAEYVLPAGSILMGLDTPLPSPVNLQVAIDLLKKL